MPGHTIAVSFNDPADADNYYYWRFKSFEKLIICAYCPLRVLRNGSCNNAAGRHMYACDTDCWQVKYSKKEKRRWIGDWTFTIYNLYSRRNPFNLYYAQRNGLEDADVFIDSPLGSYELSVLNSPLLSITYNFVFQ